MMTKLAWGVLGTAKIARQKVIPALQRSHYCQVRGIASRDLASAQTVAQELGIPQAYGSYEALLADPSIQAVYIPLPNHLHVPWAIKALEAGKHVLCEKPLGLTSQEAQHLVEIAAQYPELKIMEAFMYRFHEQWQTAKNLVESGAIGELKAIQSFFSYFNADATNIRNQADLGGGGLMDIGCYCISLARFLFNAEPLKVCGLSELDPQFGVDRLSSGLLSFAKGQATFTCSTQLMPYQRVNIVGTQGRIEIEIPFNPLPTNATKLGLHTAQGSKESVFEPQDQYTRQGDAFAQAVFNKLPTPTPLTDAVANMRAIEALALSAKQGQWIQL